MTTQELKKIETLVNSATKAAKTAKTALFEIETMLSKHQIATGKSSKHKNAKELFSKLGIS